MTRVIGIVAAAFVLAMTGTAPVAAQGSGASGAHPRSAHYRGKSAQVRGYAKRRGGYSYSAEDTINTYGDSRTRFGSSNTFRDPMLDRQTRFGPFDNGFFFDSGILPRGGNSPYPN